MAQTPLLEIDTKGTTEAVIIDRKEYALTDFDSFSVLDQHKIQKLGKRVLELMGSDALDEDGAKELMTLADDLFLRISGNIPEKIITKLQPGARQRITSAYFLAFRGREDTEAPTLSDDGQSETSQDSSDSTEEPQENG